MSNLGLKGKKIESFESYESRIIVIEAKYIIRKSYVDLVDAISMYLLQTSLGKNMPILYMLEVSKLFMYIVTFVKLGVDARSA